MKKIILNLTIASAIATTLSADYLKQAEVDKISNMSFFKETGLQISKVYDVGSIYGLSVKNGDGFETIYLTKDKKYLIAGNVISLDKKEKFNLPLSNIDIAKGKESFTFGTGSDEIYLFTDPECPFCKKFEEYLPQLEAKAKIRVFHLPLDIHPNARELSKYHIYKSKTDKNIKEIMAITTEDKGYQDRKYDEKTEKELEKTVNDSIDIAMKFGVEGTPFIVRPNGEIVNWVKFLEYHGIKIQDIN